MSHTPDEVKELVNELRELKNLLREVSSKLERIEALAKRASLAVSRKTSAGSRTTAARTTDPPTISQDEALELYDELVALADRGNRDEVQQRLENMSLPDLSLLSRAVGVSLGRRRRSQTVLIEGVWKRIRESMMLSMSSLQQRSERPDEENHGGRLSVEQADEPSPTANSQLPRNDNAV